MLYKKLWLNLWVFAVTTFAVVWIEIAVMASAEPYSIVTTFAVVWIEIHIRPAPGQMSFRHHLRGGVD